MESNTSSAPSIASPTCLAEDLCIDILKRLPIETLIRFRCVCKSWNSVISSPFFINLHHSFTSSSTPSNLKLYLCNGYNVYYPNQSTRVHHHTHDLHYPFRALDSCIAMGLDFVDVIHGVFCVSYSLNSSFDSNILWNPAIHKYLALPRLPFPSHFERAIADFGHARGFDTWVRVLSFSIGFGYDSCKNDFKVVRIWNPWHYFQPYGDLFPTTYEVYSAREGLWRAGTISNIKYRNEVFTRIGATCFVNGTIHWVVSKSFGIHSVLMFDCEREEFKLVEFPQSIYNKDGMMWEKNSTNVEVVEYGGMVSILVKFYGNPTSELWVMEEHGVASSWKKLFRIPNPMTDIDIYQPSFLKLAPYGPKQWIKDVCRDGDLFDKILRYHVYEETLCLMDHPKVQSYTNMREVIVDHMNK